MRKIGIFAGTFDPIHDGHIEVVQNCKEYLEMDEVYFMVEASPWGGKNPTANYSQRVRMAEMVGENVNGISVLRLDDDRFTIDGTLPKIEKMFEEDELYFILGADVFMKMDSNQWPGLDKLLEHYIVVFERGKFNADDIQIHEKELGIAAAVFGSPHPEHSSSDVRMHPHKKDIWVPQNISNYIDEQKLYL